jgi:hypothetical protein
VIRETNYTGRWFRRFFPPYPLQDALRGMILTEYRREKQGEAKIKEIRF